MSRTLYVPPQLISGNQISIPEGEAHHAFKVLRAKVGDSFLVVDGEGAEYDTILRHIDRNSGSAEIVAARRGVGELEYVLDLAISPLKNKDRWEFAVEKATELGVTNIIPLLSRRTEKSKLNLKRLEMKMVSALKQSGRSVKPNLRDSISFEEIQELGSDYDFVVLCSAFGNPDPLTTILAKPGVDSKILLLIGPEGGFTKEEVESGIKAGMKIASLGPRRLRTETAAIVAISQLTLR